MPEIASHKAATPLPEGSGSRIYSCCSGGVWGRAPLKRRVSVFTVTLLLALCMGMTKPLAAHESEHERHNIPWIFAVYEAPDFHAQMRGFFNPQPVRILQQQDDGWAQIITYSGNWWVYLNANMRFIPNTVPIIDNYSDQEIGALSPQVVRIVAQEGSWLQIATWLGYHWINWDRASNVRLVALTFDDGPSHHTPRLLDELYARNVPATFFVLGGRVYRYPHIAQRIVNEGHEIANHAFSHDRLVNLSNEKIRDLLTQNRDVIYRTTGTLPAVMRPPFGAHNYRVLDVAYEMGYPVVLWSVDTRDWQNQNVNAIMRHVVDNSGNIRIRDGDIILMHDIYSTTVDAAIRMVDLLLANGFTFVTVSEMLEHRHRVPVAGQVYN